MKTNNMLNLNAILEYEDAILRLDSSIVCKTYENDLIFIIAIDDDKYEQFKKDINHIFYKLYSKFELEKKIVCMPNKFVSKWDTPIVLIDSKINVEVMAHCHCHKYNLNQTKGAPNGCAA